jgi:23S rRNA G2445 N2-methylase RlmL
VPRGPPAPGPIVEVVGPQLGETVYDPAVGSAGFLCEAYEYLTRTNTARTTAQDKALQERTFYGKEKKSLAYVIAIMNMILHGIEAPNILHTNSLTENLADVQEKDRFDLVLANPPFGGSERKEVQQNFPIRTAETAYLFLQHFIKMLRGVAARESSSRARFSRTQTMRPSVCASSSSRLVTCTPFLTAPQGHSRVLASRPSSSFSPRVLLPRASGTTSSIRGEA